MKKLQRKIKGQVRQGDVLVMPTKEVLTGTLQTGKQIILAHGEATGHHHSVADRDAADWWKHGDEQSLDVKTPTEVQHQEHAPVPLTRGKKRVIQQREYSPAAIRNVAD